MTRGTKSDQMAPQPTPNRVTLRDVAQAAGVTPMTVSNVVTGRQGAVSVATAARILEVVQRLGYRPNAIGRRLRTQRTNAWGVVILDNSPAFLADPFTTTVIAGLSNFASENGQSLVLQGLHTSDRQDAPLLSHMETDGIFVFASGPYNERSQLFDRVQLLRQPTVLFQERHTGGDNCTVRQEDRRGAFQLARLLLRHDAKRIFLLLPSNEWPAMIERELGVREAVKGTVAKVTIVRCGDEGILDTKAALSAALIRDGIPDAIMGGNDRMAIAALQVLAERKIPVPDRVRVTGFNAFEFARYATPSLTTARSPAYEMGRKGAMVMLTRLSEGRFGETDLVLPIEIVDGESA